MGSLVKRITSFYDRYENLNLKVTFVLIALQLIHLYWLATDIILVKLVGQSWFPFPDIPAPLFVAIDYLEIPALFSGMVVYAMAIRRRGGHIHRNVLFMAILAAQVFHLFWITDEVVYDALFNVVPIQLPIWLVWIAILVDYLELPIIWDLFRKAFSKKKK